MPLVYLITFRTIYAMMVMGLLIIGFKLPITILTVVFSLAVGLGLSMVDQNIKPLTSLNGSAIGLFTGLVLFVPVATMFNSEIFAIFTVMVLAVVFSFMALTNNPYISLFVSSLMSIELMFIGSSVLLKSSSFSPTASIWVYLVCAVLASLGLAIQLHFIDDIEESQSQMNQTLFSDPDKFDGSTQVLSNSNSNPSLLR